MRYKDFITAKSVTVAQSGFEAPELNSHLFDWQKDIVMLALRRGKSCIFADCGLGKTIMQLEWAYRVCRHTGANVLIVAPLAVAAQTEREGMRFGIQSRVVRDQSEVEPGISITNYEMLNHFDPSKFAGVVLDESSIIKNHDAKTRDQITEMFRDTAYILACTATPAPNDQMELGTHAELVGAMTREAMLSMFFVHDGSDTSKWRLKGHAKQLFYDWMAEWSVMISKPSDIGYPDNGFILPTLDIKTHVVDVEVQDDTRLFAVPSQGLTDQRKARKVALSKKVEAIADKVNGSSDQWVVWCDYNDESDALAKAIPDAVEVRGSDTPQHKTDAMLGFSSGKYRVIVSKPSICGFGMNWQNCHNVAFCGLSYSYESFYQAIRRCWRYGQENRVTVDIYSSIEESSTLDSIVRKEEQMQAMHRGMVKAMADQTVKKIKGESHQEVSRAIESVETGQSWKMMLGDSCERTSEIDSNSVGLSVFSPPFASLYTYSDSDRDMGNSKDYEEFFTHFSFLINEIYRVMIPGRSVCIHCMNLPTSKQHDGFIGIRDFRGDIIRAFQSSGFIYHSEVTIWKNPVTSMQRTKALGLLHKTIRKDSSMSRQGIADYVVVMRKPGENPEPIKHTPEEFPVSLWQEWASPVWMDINQSNTLNGRGARENADERHICPLQLEVIERCVGLWSNPGDIVFSPFGGIGSEGYQSVLMGRRYIGIELKDTYYRCAVNNLREAEMISLSPTLFDEVVG